MSRRLPAVAVAAVLAGGVLALPGPAGAAVRDCSAKVDFNMKITSVRNMTCTRARTVMRNRKGSISRRFTTGGFTCTRVMGTSLSGEWRCVSGRRAFRFVFGD